MKSVSLPAPSSDLIFLKPHDRLVGRSASRDSYPQRKALAQSAPEQTELIGTWWL